MKLAATLLLTGIALIFYGLTLSPYKDEKLYMERYGSLSVGQSEAFWKLRDEMLTAKFQLEDYGITLVALAIPSLLLTRKNQERIGSPKSRKTLVALAVALPFITVGGYIFDLFQAFNRGEFPHWADSMGIPLMGVPVQFIFLLLWSLAHLGFLRGAYSPAPLSLAMSFKANKWLLFISVFTAVLVLFTIAAGEYWYAVPGLLWLYLYMSLGAGRRAAKNESLLKFV